MLRFSFRLTVMTLVFSNFSTISPLAQERLPSLIKRIQNSVVSVLAFGENGAPLHQGSGFFMDTLGRLVTNRHVLEGAARAQIKTSRGEFYAITTVVAENREADLVVVSVDTPPSAVSPIRMAPTLPEVGEQILVIGSPLGLEQTVSEGIVSAIREVPSIGKIIQTTAAVSRGSSGSPVINLNGQVIGIATFQLVEGQNLNFAVPAAEVLKLRLSHGKPLAQWNVEWLQEQAKQSRDEGRGRRANRRPIAIANFKTFGHDSVAAELISVLIASVIARDLEKTNWFDVLDKSSHIEKPERSGITLGSFDFKDWSAIGAEALIRGGVLIQTERLTVELRLFDVHQRKEIVGKRYTGRRDDNIQIAHKFADEVIFQFTGVRGTFEASHCTVQVCR